jgi:hemoglobin
MMKKLLGPKMILIALLAFAFLAGAALAQEKPKSLYARLGGYDAIAAVTDDFFGRMMKDPQLGRFFKNLGEDSKEKARQLTVDLLCHMTGGPCFYIGRDMKKTHKGMGINESDWDLSVKYLKETLNQFKVPAKEQGEVLQAISGTKKDIVEAGAK